MVQRASGASQWFTRVRVSWIAWFLGAGVVAAWFVVPAVLTRALDGDTVDWLNVLVQRNAIKAPDVRDASYYEDLGRTMVLRLALVMVFVGGLATWLVTRQRDRVVGYLSEPSYALNLAVFRIVVCWLALTAWSTPTRVDTGADSIIALPGWGPLLDAFPASADTNADIYEVFRWALLLSLFGIGTRWSTKVAVVLGAYVMGLGYLGGKVDHNQSVWLFLLYLSASPSGDALSIDTLIRRRNPLGPATPSRVYGWPLRWGAVTLGIIYFFPGIWKFIISGFGWAFSGNLENKLHNKWFELGRVPDLRIDRYPLLTMGAAAFTMVIEIFFVFALFHPRTRRLWVAGALSLHVGIRTFMSIWFQTLVYSYVLFIDWYGLGRRIGRRLGWITDSMDDSPPAALDDRSVPTWVPKTACAAMALCGVLLIDTWPVSVYPTFAATEPATTTSYIVTIVDESGERFDILPLREPAVVREFGARASTRAFLQRMAIESDPATQLALTERLWVAIAPTSPTDAPVTMEVFQAEFATDPDEWDAIPAKGKLVATADLVGS